MSIEADETKIPELSVLMHALLDPQVYPHRPDRVELIQTQISAVFLAGEYVYKIKKPVDFGFLDFTTLEKRRFYCGQEVILNRRLCDETYLGVIPITLDGSNFSVEGSGTEIEYAVKMRPLPQDLIMQALLSRGLLTDAMLRRVAERLVQFHSQARLSDDQATVGGFDTVKHNVDENFDQVEAYINRTITHGQYDSIKGYARTFLHNNRPLFEKRVRGGRIRDCHGDLHAAHICFKNGICIFDCIEFNDRFRYIDVASEVAFLAMDLDFHGEPALSNTFIDSYVQVSGDQELLALLDFYKCYRAYVRGKVEGFKLEDPNISEAEKSKTVAVTKRYFALAESYARD